jgi:Ca2+/H+ antiporter, TMEM165/GDT1 family
MQSIIIAGIAFILFFFAEIGDKTQLMTISLASRYKPWPVFGGVFLGMCLVTIVGVTIGTFLYNFISILFIKIIAATIFILFGIYTFFSKEKDEKIIIKDSHVFRNSFLLSSLAEMGDKTQFAVIGITAHYAAPLPVLLGSIAGLALIIGIGVFFGKTISKHIESEKIKIATAVLFIAIGLVFLAEIFI